LPCSLSAQQTFAVAAVSLEANAIPDAPVPQVELAMVAEPQAAQPAASSSSSQAPAPQPSTQQNEQQKTEQQKAAEEVKEEEHQRVEGIIPTFNVTYHHDAAPLSPRQKIDLSLHSVFDPFAFGSAFLEAGYHEAKNDLSGFSWGPKGYFERSGAAYLDTFDGNFLGNGVLPIVFRQDPRFFRLGHGSVAHRVLYAISTCVIAKSDRTRRWEPNYSNVLGNVSAGALSNLYYPGSNSGFSLTISNAMVQIVEGGGGSEFNEFWPDISRKLLHKDPTRGLDAQTSGQIAVGNPPTAK